MSGGASGTGSVVWCAAAVGPAMPDARATARRSRTRARRIRLLSPRCARPTARRRRRSTAARSTPICPTGQGLCVEHACGAATCSRPPVRPRAPRPRAAPPNVATPPAIAKRFRARTASSARRRSRFTGRDGHRRERLRAQPCTAGYACAAGFQCAAGTAGTDAYGRTRNRVVETGCPVTFVCRTTATSGGCTAKTRSVDGDCDCGFYIQGVCANPLNACALTPG